MNNTKNLSSKEAIDKLISLVNDINICLFCTNLKTDIGATARPMSAIKVCDQGNIWFFSEKNSDKNQAIDADNNVQLFFSHPGNSRYLIVNGEAEIIFDKDKIEELWTPAAKIWFEGGKDDPDISVIKVTPTTAYYWDTDGNQMINLLKMAASVVSGNNLISGTEGAINI
ncbi:MAG: pyridoxamine 5'-phosphate oxidase family protein [Saprospiraceae bacterium]|nr:pyridoxamine 5'-phosphate oxidase family protein [Saprospiraceae bacterium]